MPQPKIRRRKLTDYVPDAQNANMGSERGLQLIETSLQKVGVGRSLVADANDVIGAGNQTIQAAMNAGIEDVIEIETDGKALIVHKRTDWDLTDNQGAARQYAYLDNRTSEINLHWDANQIALDTAAGIDLTGIFLPYEFDALTDLPNIGSDGLPPDTYNRKIEVPLYEPSEQKPELSALLDDSKSKDLIARINATIMPEEEKHFLKLAATRHIVFNYAQIADWYAHSDAEVQRLMEESALVIVDFDRALELGYVKFSESIGKIVGDGEAEDDHEA